jgi:hypothetical protein
MPKEKTPLVVLTVRVPQGIVDRLPAPSLTGERAKFIRDAIEEKLNKRRKPRA